MFVVLYIIMWWLLISGLIYLFIRKKTIRLSLGQIIVFFGCKIIAGAGYGYIFKRFYNGDDTWGLNNDGLQQYKRLLQSPLAFFSDIFSTNPIPPDGAFYFHFYGYLENLEYSIFCKIIAPFNFFSQGNYYINIVFFNFLGFFGLYFIYKLIAERINVDKRFITAAVLFMFPPALFWLSGIRAEGLICLCTGILLYQFDQWLTKAGTWRLPVCFAAFAMIFMLRDGFAIILMPWLMFWGISVRYQTSIKKTLGITVLLLVSVILISSSLLPQQMNPLTLIAGRQHAFFLLKGNTRFGLTALDNSLLSFIKVLPEATLNTFVRPFFWEAKGPLQWFAALENTVVLALVFTWVIGYMRTTKSVFYSHLCWVLVLTALCNYILIGYIVPFPGAIVRYKIIPELLLLSACLLYLPTKKRHLTTAS